MTKRLVPWMNVRLGNRLFTIRGHAQAWGHKGLADEMRQYEWQIMNLLAAGGKIQECECALEKLCHRLDDQTLKLCKILVEVGDA